MYFLDVTAWTVQNLVIRIVAASILGALIGIDRGAKRRGGGARTDAAVCVGAAVGTVAGPDMEFVSYQSCGGDERVQRWFCGARWSTE